jgi:hypothetical protein
LSLESRAMDLARASCAPSMSKGAPLPSRPGQHPFEGFLVTLVAGLFPELVTVILQPLKAAHQRPRPCEYFGSSNVAW